MKPASKPFALKMVFSVSFLFLSLFLASNIFASNIQGVVYDKQRNILPDIDVELLNDYYQSIKRTRTDGSGRYTFDGLNDGRFTVKVLAFRYDLEDQEIPVEINTQGIQVSASGTSVGQGNGTFIQDFYLLPKKGGLRDSELGVIFAQEIPKEARSAYELALQDFSKKRDEAGFNNLKKALGVFPTYYQALHRFGLELFMRKQYLEAAQAFMEAVKVNPKSATSFYYLGFAFFNLGEKYNKAATTSLNQAFILAPASPQVLYLLGKVERATGKFTDAEKHLLQAKKLSTAKIPDIHWELALLYGNNMKKYKEAADELELYLKASKLEAADEQTTKKLIADFREKAKTNQ
jgi:tetratricopeptide (TPR) repeat protein